MLSRIQAWDESVLVRLLNKRTPKLNKIMVLFTMAGDHGRVWIAFSMPFLIMNKWRITGFAMLLAMGFAFLGGEITIKHIVGRVRPCNEKFEKDSLIKNPPQYSFPSGHTTSSFAFSTVVLWLCPIFFLPALIIASLIAFSRVYLLVHYPTDIFAGIVLGIICGIVAVPVSYNLSFLLNP